ncbi:MAG TPA: ABC transporter permease [Armatimonadota bacterium]|jgi:lipopolysaccharide transport system permease protein
MGTATGTRGGERETPASVGPSAPEGARSAAEPRPREEWSSRDANGLGFHLREIWKFRELMWTLSLRSLKSRYSQTLLGASWAILQPLLLTGVFTLVFARFAKVDTGGAPYPVFAYAAMLPWQLFSNIITKGTSSVVENGAIVKKIYLPREICPLSALLVSLVDFAVAALPLVIFMVIFRVPPSILLVFLPVLLLIEVLFSLGIILFLSAIGVFYRDVGFALPLILQVGMFLCPVAYALSSVPPEYLRWYLLNPLTPLVDGFRRIVVYQQMPQWDYVAYAAGVALVVLWLGYAYFKRSEGRFADVL